MRAFGVEDVSVTATAGAARADVASRHSSLLTRAAACRIECSFEEPTIKQKRVGLVRRLPGGMRLSLRYALAP